ncbi:O-acetyl-ADP-ribose deacetylase [Gleimia europaea]|nr:O-acetyl-ADP-ribose deacetylase [Gleimia europaea]MDK8534337.1 O-acetyl-ADP-ribose deacetylase [Gleimia europaea]
MNIIVEVADITLLEVDVIVNAANSSLLGGGGVDGAIHRAAGPGLLKECRKIRDRELPDGLPTGQAIATKAYDLQAFWVVHTVGPNRHAGEDDPHLLESAFWNSLELAAQLGARSVAFPAISAGTYGWGMDEVARVAASAVMAWNSAENDACRALQTIIFAVTNENARVLFESALTLAAGSFDVD